MPMLLVLSTTISHQAMAANRVAADAFLTTTLFFARLARATSNNTNVTSNDNMWNDVKLPGTFRCLVHIPNLYNLQD